MDTNDIKRIKPEKNPGAARSNALLFLTAAIWGSSFVAQSVGGDLVGPFTFGASRMLLGALVLIPVIICLDRTAVKRVGEEAYRKERNAQRRTLCTGGLLCGLVLFAASSLQQIGIAYTTVGKAGFITSLYIVLVPVLGLFLKRRVGGRVWGSIILALTGLYLLCIAGQDGGFALGLGDLLVLVCAVIFSVHILLIDHFSPKTDGVRLSCIQFLFCAVLCAVCMLLFEKPRLSDIFLAYAPILYAGVLSCGVGYTLQIVAQKGVHPTIASLVLSLESVFSVLAGWVILGETLTWKETAGCVLMFGATVLAQIPGRSTSGSGRKYANR